MLLFDFCIQLNKVWSFSVKVRRYEVCIGLNELQVDNKSATWLIANLILTCSSITDLRFPSKFVVGPFLYAKVNSFYYNFLFTDLRWNTTHFESSRGVWMCVC